MKQINVAGLTAQSCEFDNPDWFITKVCYLEKEIGNNHIKIQFLRQKLCSKYGLCVCKVLNQICYIANAIIIVCMQAETNVQYFLFKRRLLLELERVIEPSFKGFHHSIAHPFNLKNQFELHTSKTIC